MIAETWMDELQRRMPLPSQTKKWNVDCADLPDWLPHDYVAFLDSYGAGSIASYFLVRVPYGESRGIDLFRSGTHMGLMAQEDLFHGGAVAWDGDPSAIDDLQSYTAITLASSEEEGLHLFVPPNPSTDENFPVVLHALRARQAVLFQSGFQEALMSLIRGQRGSELLAPNWLSEFETEDGRVLYRPWAVR